MGLRLSRFGTEDGCFVRCLNDCGTIKTVVLAAVEHHGEALADASERLRDNEEIVFAAVKSRPSAISNASERLKDNKDIALVAVSAERKIHSADAFYVISERLQHDRDILIASAQAGHPHVLVPMPEALKDDREVVLEIVKGGYSAYHMNFMSERLKGDKEIVLAMLANNPFALADASPELKDDPEVVAAATQQERALIGLASKRLQRLEMRKKIWAGIRGFLSVFEDLDAGDSSGSSES